MTPKKKSIGSSSAVNLVAPAPWLRFRRFVAEDELWTEESIPGETLDHSIDRLARKYQEQPERLDSWWPFAAWAALGAYVDFWNRTGRRLVVATVTR